MNAPLSNQASQALSNDLNQMTLDDKYTLARGQVYLTGTQALVRLALLQRERDALQGLNTAGFISGYRGSPLGAVDMALWAAKKHLASHRIEFQAGLNEDLAATAVWGSQQVNLFPKATCDGVFGMWYGKGPGVDRTGDVFKHANAAGTSRLGGVLVLAGDDHSAKSSTLPHQSDHIFKACLIPVLFPSTVQEYLDMGIHGYAMSRYAGVWVGMKCVSDVVEASASVSVDPQRVSVVIPHDFVLPAGGLNIRWPDTPLDQEARLLDYKLYAALAYCRANRLNYTVIDTPTPRLGIVSSGKAYLDTRQALLDLGLDDANCAAIGIRLYKVGMVWPLEAHGISEFAQGLEEILVVEEKRQVIEYQIKEELYNWKENVRPRVYGKFDEKITTDGLAGGEWAIPQADWLLPAHYELNAALVAKAIAKRLERFSLPADIKNRIDQRLQNIRDREQASKRPHPLIERKPYFCSGCPHNTSTQVPEGSRATAGIGCHYMVVWMDRKTETYTQMGGEGVPWIGQAAFTETRHIFANLGDGTYFHSGILAIRASVSAKVNITYKILYNDAVAMTGGQPVDGVLTVPRLVLQLQAEGVSHIVVVSDEPDKYIAQNQLARGVEVFHRDRLDSVQQKLREMLGTTVLIYDQTCASEKRRRRKRKDSHGNPLYPDPPKRVVINERVCEGCGDCSVQSNCLSIEPVSTDYGIKRRINQSSCNKDFSCIKGFCPSFVTVEGGVFKANQPNPCNTSSVLFDSLPEPTMQELGRTLQRYSILITGVGGTGVVTIGAWLGMAAHLEGKGVSVLDMAGLAQKGGAVFSHVQLAVSPDGLFATRIATGEADVLLGGDLIVSASVEALACMKNGAYAIVNTDTPPTADFIKHAEWMPRSDALQSDLIQALNDDGKRIGFMPAQSWMIALLGDSVYANAFLLGYAWQKGWIPLGRVSIERAIELNAVQVSNNLLAFNWGRLAAHDEAAVRMAMVQNHAAEPLIKQARSSQQRILDYAHELTCYQNAGLAKRYQSLLEHTNQVASVFCVDTRLLDAVAEVYFRLLAIKDEYEVARLHTSHEFIKKIQDQFDGAYKLVFHLSPPVLVSNKANSPQSQKPARPRKIAFGAWMLPFLKILKTFKFLRGTPFDVFSYTHERALERSLIPQFEKVLQQLLSSLNTSNVDDACHIVYLFKQIKGYGHIKENNFKQFQLFLNEDLALYLKGACIVRRVAEVESNQSNLEAA